MNKFLYCNVEEDKRDIEGMGQERQQALKTKNVITRL